MDKLHFLAVSEVVLAPNAMPLRVTDGYVGAVSDGRYIYFSPDNNGSEFSGNVLRFDARLPRIVPPTVTGGSNL